MVKIRTDAQYEEAFESLMKFVGIKDVRQIKSREDLRDFFGKVKEDSRLIGRKFPLTKKFVFKFAEARNRLLGRPPKVLRTRREDVLISRKIFLRFEDAQRESLTILNPDSINVFRSQVVIRKKTIIIFRDKLGRFRRAPQSRK